MGGVGKIRNLKSEIRINDRSQKSQKREKLFAGPHYFQTPISDFGFRISFGFGVFGLRTSHGSTHFSVTVILLIFVGLCGRSFEPLGALTILSTTSMPLV